MIDKDYNRRKFDEFCDQAADLGRRAATLESRSEGTAQLLNRMRSLVYRATARGMDHEQLDAIGRAAATAYEDGCSRIDIKRSGGR